MSQRPPEPSLLRIPPRTETVDLGGLSPEYAGLEVMLWLNPPEQWVADCLARQTVLAITEMLATLIRAWNIELADGGIAAITPETVGALPGDVLGYIHDEFGVRRHAPLVQTRTARSAPTSAASPPAPTVPDMSDMIGSSSSPNGSSGP